MPKMDKYIRFKYYGKKIKSSFLIYAYFESNLIPEDNEKKIQMSLEWTNIENMLLKVMVIN